MSIDKEFEGLKELPEPVPYSDEYRNDTTRFILHILEDEFGLKGIDRPDLNNIAGAYQSDGGNFWLLKVDDEIVGTIALRNYGNGCGYLKRMYVAENMRRKGIAKHLLTTLLTYARQHGYTELYLGTVGEMDAAIKFYQSQGFQRIKALPEGMPECGDSVFFKFDLYSSRHIQKALEQ
ncbi:MAG: N-acetyltransferase GCN5 [Candidatus Peregrinibacteria bacterium Greene0416_19]|nr:MAG: N-acetyltransferase GCN5 [Candidatus Peregrinibacteria bacterium Greene0416_19]